MNTIPRATNNLTAEDVMHRDLAVAPQQMLVREAARLLHRVGVSAAAVVDENGHCVGMLTPADVFRWVEAGCPETVVGPALTCQYQVRGRPLTGHEAVICTLVDGSCPFQRLQPTLGGGHMGVCTRKGDEHPPAATVPPYMTNDDVTVRPQTPLLQLVQRMINARADRVVVLDQSDRPIGIVSATDVLSAITDGGGRDCDSGDPVAQ
jgi:CBS domain-containing protein